MLPAGSTFQPWQPEEQWRGERVPITLGSQNIDFDWGVTSSDGHFLRWDDFFARCEPGEGTSMDTLFGTERTEPQAGDGHAAASEGQTIPVLSAPDASDPFAAIAAMRHGGGDMERRFRLDDTALDDLFSAATALQKAHDYAAEMQLGAEGFDNMDTARHYDYVRQCALATASELAKTCEALLK